MYIGSTDERGMLHCLWEIIDNAVDEALNASCTKIEIILHADDSAEVRDNGRGIPVDIEPKTGLNGVELIMTRLHAGGKFGGSSYTASGGLHGVGASVVNALSGRLDVWVDREGYEWYGSFRRGVPGEFAGDGPDAKFKRASGLRKLGALPKSRSGTRTGTRIRFWPDKQVFVPGARMQFDSLIERVRQTAYLVPNLSLMITDERVSIDDGNDQPKTAEFSFSGGISEFCAYLSGPMKTSGTPVTDVLR
ncbi:MAG TPA: ATP-binding protein, partial [Streptosporangiaceae bacterium]